MELQLQRPQFIRQTKRGSLRYGEAVELADALGYAIVWQKKKSGFLR